MSTGPKAKLTTRAYTLRLRGIDDGDHSWRDNLWAMHEGINKGAKAFGDWLLTLRGGLSHELVTAQVTTKKGDRQSTKEEIRERRVLLALGWLDVESKLGAPTRFVVAEGNDPSTDRDQKVKLAFQGILRKRKLSEAEIEDWWNDCQSALSATIRQDAVWVNRDAAFDAAVYLSGRTRDHAESILGYLFGDIAAFLRLETTGMDDDGHKAGVAEPAKDFAAKARGWVSKSFGTGRKTDWAQVAKTLRRLATIPPGQFIGRSGRELANAFAQELGAKGVADLDKTLKALKQAVGWQQGRKGYGAIQRASKMSLLGAEDIATLQETLRTEADERQEQAAQASYPWVVSLQPSAMSVSGSGGSWVVAR